MIIKIFNQGTGDGSNIIKYLMSEEKHQNYKPKILQGSLEITKSIIQSLKFKNKYITGVISFREGEDLTKAQQLELIDHFQKSFCPFDEQARTNFLFVEHRDKGRLEIHFLSPRVDLKTGKAFNMHPPGKQNLFMYKCFTRLQNLKYGFKQVDNKELTSYQVRYYKDSFTDLFEKRKEFLYNRFQIKQRELNGKYRTNSNFNNGKQSKNFTPRKLFKPNSQTTAGISSNHNENNAGSTDFKNFSEFLKSTNDSFDRLNQQGARDGGILNQNVSQQKALLNSLSIPDRLRALGMLLNYASPFEYTQIITEINQLQGQLNLISTEEQSRLKPR